jgi:hypothetical protein
MMQGRASRDTAYFFFFGLTAALSVAPAEKRGVLEAAILITSPVAGLRPLRAVRLVIEAGDADGIALFQTFGDDLDDRVHSGVGGDAGHLGALRKFGYQFAFFHGTSKINERKD